MLCRNQDGVDTLWDHSSIDLLVLNCDLGFAVRPQPAHSAILPDLCQLVPNLGGQHVCQRHQFRGLICGVAKHVTLVASTCINILLSPKDKKCNVCEYMVLKTYNNVVHACQVQNYSIGSETLQRRDQLWIDHSQREHGKL